MCRAGIVCRMMGINRTRMINRAKRDVVDDVSKGISCRELRYSESDGVCL
jgi:hypothetical protein